MKILTRLAKFWLYGVLGGSSVCLLLGAIYEHPSTVLLAGIVIFIITVAALFLMRMEDRP
jgi:lipid-A-disaccharide synthase-like uncharacterized protein